jgi:S1-C subfamily serine protease
MNFIQAVKTADELIFQIQQENGRISSGFPLDVDGSVVMVSTAHGFDPELAFTATNGKTKIELKLIGTDWRFNLAVFEGYSDAAVKPSAKAPETGEFVASLGRPGQAIRAAFGMISVSAESWKLHHGIELKPYFEVDGSLPKGFTGGPLVNTSGEVFGMNSSLPRGMGMTLGIEQLKALAAKVMSGEAGKTAYLGVNTAPADGGLVITEIDKESRAAESELMVGDLIRKINGTDIQNPHDLSLVFMEGPGTYSIDFSRGGTEHHMSLELDERGKDKKEN